MLPFMNSRAENFYENLNCSSKVDDVSILSDHSSKDKEEVMETETIDVYLSD